MREYYITFSLLTRAPFILSWDEEKLGLFINSPCLRLSDFRNRIRKRWALEMKVEPDERELS